MNLRFLQPLLLALLTITSAHAQSSVWSEHNWSCTISAQGHIEQIVFHEQGHNDTIPFFTAKGFPGPSFYVCHGDSSTIAEWQPAGQRAFVADIDGIRCELTYTAWRNLPALTVRLTNHSHTPFQPTKAGLKLGVDTYMDQYPEWNGKHFPTHMRNEQSHFFGYMETPGRHVLGIVSPDPVASWSVDYNLGYQDPAPYWFMGHRIESLNLDLMNALPLPDHNPQQLWQLADGESMEWHVAFVNVPSVADFEQTIHKAAALPMLSIDETSADADGKAVFKVYGQSPKVCVTDADGQPLTPTVRRLSTGFTEYSLTLPHEGLYSIRVDDGQYSATGQLLRHKSWQWALERAREAAWSQKQKATSHIESWYGFHSAFIAARHFPSSALDSKLRQRFDYLYTLLHDTTATRPLYHAERIQNTSGTIGLLVDKYEAYGDTTDLRHASELADWLLNGHQRQDGAYMSWGTVYTSVIYVAKSMLELSLAEQRLGRNDATWRDRSERHYASALRAIDQLVAAQGNFETEGQMTFEDGMVSCSALQMGMAALMQTDTERRRHYTEAMLDVLQSHECLTQMRVPDARRRGGTMRYWEAQYDVQMLPNMFNSPHGWSAWRAYATYYAYLLTGDEQWLQQTYNAASAFSCLADYRTGQVRWAFVVDPYLQVTQTCSADTRVTADSLSFGNPHPLLYQTRRFVIGEQYVPMISDWQTVNTQDNDVHEVFKFIGEAMLTNAFVVEQPDGTLRGYNCRVSRKGGVWQVEPTERQMTHLHANLRHAQTIRFGSATRQLEAGYMGWAFGGDEYRFE